MIKDKRVLAVVPARSGSKGLPGKNVREFCGKPLLNWSIEHGKSCSYIDKVFVSTDSSEIASIAVKSGVCVPILRPANLSGDNASSINVLLHVIDYLKNIGENYDIIVMLEPTSPLRDISDISGALELLVEKNNVESVVGVARAEGSHPSFLFTRKNDFITPMLGRQPNGLRRQDVNEEYYYLEGSIYVSYIKSLKENCGFYSPFTAPWIVERYKSIEIDELSDFIAAEALMKAKLSGEIK